MDPIKCQPRYQLVIKQTSKRVQRIFFLEGGGGRSKKNFAPAFILPRYGTGIDDKET